MSSSQPEVHLAEASRPLARAAELVIISGCRNWGRRRGEEILICLMDLVWRLVLPAPLVRSPIRGPDNDGRWRTFIDKQPAGLN